MLANLAPEALDLERKLQVAPERLPQLHVGIAKLPEDLRLPSILPHREVFDFLGRVADAALKVPAASFGWMFENGRPWSKLLD